MNKKFEKILIYTFIKNKFKIMKNIKDFNQFINEGWYMLSDEKSVRSNNAMGDNINKAFTYGVNNGVIA
jgi:hypothetical protein